MFDIGWSEMLVVALVAVVVIGPKDLPRVMRTVGQWSTRARGMAREFQNSMDEMARQADIDDMRKKMAEMQTDVNNSVNSALDPNRLTPELVRPDYLPTPDDLMNELARSGPPPIVTPGVSAAAPAPAVAPAAPPSETAFDPDAPVVIPANGDAVAAAADPAPAVPEPVRRAEG